MHFNMGENLAYHEGEQGAGTTVALDSKDKPPTMSLAQDQYHWGLKIDGDAKQEADRQANWPWKKDAFKKQGHKAAVGATPWR